MTERASNKMEQAQHYMDAGRFEEAESIYRSVLEQDSGNTEAVYMLAIARRAQGDLDEALELMSRASELDPENVNIQYTLGTLHMDRRSVDAARSAYLKALQIDPFHIDSHNGVAFVELVAGNFSAAERAANLALTEDENNAQALVYLGAAKLELGDADTAISYLQEALKNAPGHRSAQMLLGRAFMTAGNAAFAVQCFHNVVETDPESGAAWEQLAGAQVAAGQVPEASQSYVRAISLGRKSPENLNALAECEQALGNTEQAEQLQATAGEADALSFEGQLTRARLEISLGKPASALDILEGLDGPDSEAVTLLKAQALEQAREPQAALSLLEPLVAEGDASDEARFTLARLLMKSGREAEADEVIDALLASDQPIAAAQIYRGFQLCRKGDEQGIAMLRDIERQEGLPENDRNRVNKMLATTLDAAGRYQEAAPHYGKLEGRLAQALVVAQSTALANRELMDNSAAMELGVRNDSAGLPADPVFQFAWPGSGWEWLASGLDAHRHVMLVADKAETQVARRALISEPAGSEGLAGLTNDAAGEAAARYWAHLRTGGLEPADRLTVDTMWISADMLPTIARLFPSARLMVVRRDPREMLLEWFRSGYSDLREMAATYREQLEALDGYLSLLDLSVIEVDGGALQDNGEQELRGVIERLGLPWDDAVAAQLEELAKIATPGRGAWQDYREVLEEPLQALGA